MNLKSFALGCALALGIALAHADTVPTDAADAAYQAQDWGQTLKLYRQVVAANPMDGRAWYRLATAARHRDDRDVANKALDESLKNGVPAAFAEMERARLLARDKAASLAAIGKAVAAGFSNPDGLKGEPLFAAFQDQPEFVAFVVQAEANKTPCANREPFRQFDFWIGEWEVRDARDNVAGTNRIARVEGGCYLYEEWVGAGGSTGSSMNYYDAARDKWVQHWVSQGGTQIQIEGGLEDGSMVLVGNIYYLGTARQADFRGRWTPLEDGRVRQLFEQSVDGGDTWSPWFEGFYARLPDGSRDGGAARATELADEDKPGPRVYFIAPADGATLAGEFAVKFGLAGLGVAPAGSDVEGTGHHHLLIDLDELPDLTRPLPVSDAIRHFGKGQTQTRIELAKGKHTLQLLVGNFLHIPHDPPLLSKKITVTVE